VINLPDPLGKVSDPHEQRAPHGSPQMGTERHSTECLRKCALPSTTNEESSVSGVVGCWPRLPGLPGIEGSKLT
jgi:hypothetical protein